MPRLVTGPDGKSWPFPDDASDAEILQFMEENTQRSSEISDIGEVTIGQKAKLMAQSAAEHTPDALKVAPAALGTRLLDTALGAIQAVPNELLGLHDPLTGKGLLRLGGEQAISALGGPSPGEQQAFKAKAPAAAGIGEGLGDILTVFAARRGGTKGLQNLPAAVGLGPPTLPAKTLKAAIEAAQPGARRFALEAADNVRSALGNLSKRVALASGEGAAFSALQDEDLSIGATAGAGLELATAPVRAISSFAVSNPLKALVTAGGAALIIPQFIPGGSDKVLDSITKGGAEGCEHPGHGNPYIDGDAMVVKMFRVIWEDIHGPDAWERNDWVFALTFNVHNRNVLEMEE